MSISHLASNNKEWNVYFDQSNSIATLRISASYPVFYNRKRLQKVMLGETIQTESNFKVLDD